MRTFLKVDQVVYVGLKNKLWKYGLKIIIFNYFILFMFFFRERSGVWGMDCDWGWGWQIQRRRYYPIIYMFIWLYLIFVVLGIHMCKIIFFPFVRFWKIELILLRKKLLVILNYLSIYLFDFFWGGGEGEGNLLVLNFCQV